MNNLEFKISLEELATFCLFSDWQIQDTVVDIISRLSESQTETLYKIIFSKARSDYNLTKITSYLYAVLKKTNKICPFHLEYAFELAELKNDEIYKDNSVKMFINFIFSNSEISEEVYFKKYESLKPFENAIFKGNPKLKESDCLKCFEAASGVLSRAEINIQLYIKNRTPNKIRSFKNISIDDLKLFPALINWRDIILRNKISDSEYIRIPTEYEELFKHYMMRDRTYFKNSFADLELSTIAAYSWDVFNYYFLYCFDLNNMLDTNPDNRIPTAIIFLDPIESMKINKTNYLTIVNKNINTYITKGENLGKASASISNDEIETFVNSPEFIEWRKNIYSEKDREKLFSSNNSWNNWDDVVSSLYHCNKKNSIKLFNMKDLFNKYFKVI